MFDYRTPGFLKPQLFLELNWTHCSYFLKMSINSSTLKSSKIKPGVNSILQYKLGTSGEDSIASKIIGKSIDDTM
jgi:hypothetical protein